MSQFFRRILLQRATSAVGVATFGASCSCAAAAAAGAPPRDDESRPLRVLITGFHDWRGLQGNVWRCRDNPACRLILGEETQAPPLSRSGPLVRALSSVAGVDFNFTTLPVTWSTAAGLDLPYFDIVIHLGLGVYDRHDTVLLEQGAYNFRNSTPDALSHAGGGAPIDPGFAGDKYFCTRAMQHRHVALARMPKTLLVIGSAEEVREDASFKLAIAGARSENTYICNETHWRALKAVEAAEEVAARKAASDAPSRLRAAYFVHLPYACDAMGGYESLARAVAELVKRIVRLETMETDRQALEASRM